LIGYNVVVVDVAIVVVVGSYPVLLNFVKIISHFLCNKNQTTQIKEIDFKSPNTSEINA